MKKNPDNHQAPGPLLRLANLFSSVWFGVTTLTVLLVYMSLGSAIPPLRQLRIFELTEMEWFSTWFFVIGSLIVCANMTTVTIRRIPFSRINLGVWMIHTGIVTLSLSSAYYFVTKVEGDAPVIRRGIYASAPGSPAISLVALPGASARVGQYSLRVIEAQPDWPILTGDDAGETTYAVRVLVQAGEEQFIRQLLAGYPQYTEDIIPGQGRAVQSTGNRLLDTSLILSMDLAPQEYFFLRDKRALYVRAVGESDWTMRRLPGLPRYNDYIAARSDVWLAHGENLQPDPIDLPAVPGKTPDALDGYDVQVTGFLRYAFEESRWVPGGAAHNPVVDFSLHSTSGAAQGFTLLAFDATRRATQGGEIVFLWVDTEEAFEALTEASPRSITITVNSSEISVDADITRTLQNEEGLAMTPIEGTEVLYRVRRFDETPTASFTAVDFETPEGAFTRWMSSDGVVMDTELGSSDERDQRPVFEGITVRFDPGRRAPPLAIVAGPNAAEPPRVLLSGDGGMSVTVRTAALGASIPVNDTLSLTLDRYDAHAQFDWKPAIVPRRQRSRDAGELFSMIRVEVTSPDGQTLSHWLPFNNYVFPSSNYNYAGRFRFLPHSITLPNGRVVELLFSRERRPLPSPVALQDFELTSHVGGFTGQTASIRDWTSQIRFLEPDGQWSDSKSVSTNKPASEAGLWYFQQSWDPPQPQQGLAGLNFTGLGVANRNGVVMMLAGSCLSVMGMLYAFYVKPVLKRRRIAQVHASVAQAKMNKAAPAEQPAESELETADVQ